MGRDFGDDAVTSRGRGARHTAQVVRRAIALVVLAACGQPATPATRSAEPRGAARFLKGQLHLHSSNSGDSATPPEDVARWYAGRGYDFIVFTDHNRVTSEVVRGDLLVIPGVELTVNLETCDPPPEGSYCPLHVNALFVDPERSASLADPRDTRRVTVYRGLVELARELGGLAQINHPNFHYGASVETIAAIAKGPLLLEVANEAIDSNNGGDATHPSTFAIWDALLDRGLVVWGTATDDAHHYEDAEAVRARGEMAFEGDRGFVMVRGDVDPTVEEIEAAMARGDFYASTGVLLDDVVCANGELNVWPQDDGAKIERIAGDGWVRAEVTDARGRKAWTQPCFTRDTLSRGFDE